MSGSLGTEFVGDGAATPVRWQSPAVLSDAEVPKRLLDLLRSPGSLTARLQAGAGDAFSVQVLRQQTCSFAAFPDHALSATSAEGLLREVYLRCHGNVAVFAQTLVPASTLGEHPWLGDLGEQPLGLRLFSRDDVVRQPFEFARIDKQSALARAALSGLAAGAVDSDRLWVRRSLFLVGDDPVSVNEVFFPSVISCLA